MYQSSYQTYLYAYISPVYESRLSGKRSLKHVRRPTLERKHFHIILVRSSAGCLRTQCRADASCAHVQVVELPALPSNARYVLHNNECYDWGTFGWALMTQDIDVNSYKYFIFMNSSVRGPYIPSYLRVRFHHACLVVHAVTTEMQQRSRATASFTTMNCISCVSA